MGEGVVAADRIDQQCPAALDVSAEGRDLAWVNLLASVPVSVAIGRPPGELVIGMGRIAAPGRHPIGV